MVQIPFVGISFQPSAFAALVLFVFVMVSKTREEPIDFVESLKELWLPVFITLMFILPSNFSTTALIFAMIIMLVSLVNIL
jgi:cell division protein FtsW